jgi:septal ring-binding cell division protein DamX
MYTSSAAGISVVLLLLLSVNPVLMAEGPAAPASTIPSSPQSTNIFAYPEDYYAVQLLAVKEKSAILKFLAVNDLGDPPYGAMVARGDILYALLLGVYPDRASAEAAVATMPATNPPVKPWIRTLGPLLDGIRQARNHPASKTAGEEQRQ